MNTNSKKTFLAGMTLQEMEKFVEENNEPKFRAKQLHYWIYKKSVNEFEKMSNLSKTFRKKLDEIAQISALKIQQKLVSKDGTIKYLIELKDGNTVETVLMSFDNRPNLTACVSTQVGCAVKCAFCATGKRGFTRNLEPDEIVDQILLIQRDAGVNVTNIVYMGQGEPLLNYDNVIKSIRIINTEVEIGMRRITISTSGIIPPIYKLAEEENRQITLALSLHAPNHELRKMLIPIEKKYHINDVVKALKQLTQTTRKRVTIEYILIKGVNDSIENARQINSLLKGLNYNINLIPYNSITDSKFKSPSKDEIRAFQLELEKFDKKVTVRLERGADIGAACGQLNGRQSGSG